MRFSLILIAIFMNFASATFAQQDEPMTFSLSQDIIIARGGITNDTPDVFTTFLKKYEKYAQNWHIQIKITSLGGYLEESLILGKLIRQHQISTTISEICASSCVYMMMGGVQREIEPNAKIGVHQFYQRRAIQDPTKQQFTGEDLIAQQKTMGKLQDYAQQMDVDSAIIALASKIEPKGIRFLTRDEISAFKLLKGSKLNEKTHHLDLSQPYLVADIHKIKNVNTITKFWDIANSNCRGTTDENLQEIACKRRSELAVVILDKFNYCKYKTTDRSEEEAFGWHKCTRNSLR